MRSSATLASAMSSSRTGPWPHHWESRCPRTRRSSPKRSRYWKRASSCERGAEGGKPTSVHPHPAGGSIELRMTIGLVVGRVEEGALLGGVGGDDRLAWHHPDAHHFAPAGIDVTGVLERQLGVGR